MVTHRLKECPINIEESSKADLRRIHFRGSQEHVDLRLRVRVHPGQLYHQQLLLEVCAYLGEDTVMIRKK